MSDSSNLNKARKEKNDEFYTQITDIRDELNHYKSQFHDKIIFCNCDDPFESNFFKYFVLNFNTLGIKKIISTSFYQSHNRGNPPFSIKGQESYAVEITNVPDTNESLDITNVEYLLKQKGNTVYLLRGDDIYGGGDFRSNECIELLKKSDIVITNPPFSLFREYIKQLISYNKKFLIIGNKNAIASRQVFSLIKENKIWMGASPAGSKDYIVFNEFNEKTIRTLGNTGWFTNLKHNKSNEGILLFKKYDPVDYPKYDNYDAIEVSKIADIPIDYYGVMGVPISFIDKYNPKQFEILGITETVGKGLSNGLWKHNPSQATINKKRLYQRLFIKRY